MMSKDALGNPKLSQTKPLISQSSIKAKELSTSQVKRGSILTNPMVHDDLGGEFDKITIMKNFFQEAAAAPPTDTNLLMS